MRMPSVFNRSNHAARRMDSPCRSSRLFSCYYGCCRVINGYGFANQRFRSLSMKSSKPIHQTSFAAGVMRLRRVGHGHRLDFRPSRSTSTAADPDIQPAVGPVTASERISSLDTLRGVAVLGILMMNIAGSALPQAAYSDPTLAGGFTGANRVVWYVNHILVHGKMRAIFSMLFGAGFILLTDRAENAALRRPRAPTSIIAGSFGSSSSA